jgi:hypothetical protein
LPVSPEGCPPLLCLHGWPIKTKHLGSGNQVEWPGKCPYLLCSLFS